ncbi:MAG: alpha-E domain-containing protein, partial [Okeania sp. SIO2C9]|uniref:alpha-E domain-containing protein n=1 Tax=Okeania sp. SIO2C9 TaxID=2607791 RepID=UPI0013BF4860
AMSTSYGCRCCKRRVYAVFEEKNDTVDQDSVVTFLGYDRESPNSIISCLRQARENARSVREVISHDMWQAINELYLDVRQAAKKADTDDVAVMKFSDNVKAGCTLVHGITDATLSRNEAWRWWRIGSMLERADKTTRILDVKYFMLLPSLTEVGGNRDRVQWLSLLSSASALQMFQQSRSPFRPAESANFLLFDHDFPRSVVYCIAMADDSLHAITKTPHGSFCHPAEQALGKLRAQLNYADIEDVISSGLHEYLDTMQTTLNQIDDMLNQHYFHLQ